MISLPVFDKNTYNSILICCVLYESYYKNINSGYMKCEEISKITRIDIKDIRAICTRLSIYNIVSTKTGPIGGYAVRVDITIKDIIDNSNAFANVKCNNINSRLYTVFNKTKKIKLSDLIDED